MVPKMRTWSIKFWFPNQMIRTLCRRPLGEYQALAGLFEIHQTNQTSINFREFKWRFIEFKKMIQRIVGLAMLSDA